MGKVMVARDINLPFHHDSWHPTSQKFAVIRALVNRMLSLPLAPGAEELETWFIERVAAVNGLKSNVRRCCTVS